MGRGGFGGGYSILPLWGDDGFNAAAGMNEMPAAAAFIHANMPVGADRKSSLSTVREAWDVAAYMTSRPRAPAGAGWAMTGESPSFVHEKLLK